MKTRKLYYLAIVVVLLVGLVPAVSNACSISDFINSIVTSAPVSFVCTPTPEQQATADAMLKVLDTAQAAGAIFYPFLGIAQASAVLTVVKNGGCFLVAQLAEAFKAVDAANVAVAQIQLKAGRVKAAMTLPQYEPLRKYVQ